MTISEKCQQLIESFEGLRLTAYRDQGGVLTIGFGHTGPDVVEGMTITDEQAGILLLDDLETAEQAVNSAVEAPLSQHEFDALVSFVYNVGINAFKSSTLLKLLNEDEYEQAADQFPGWDHVNGIVVPGLAERRAAERALFLS
jgi:lysozyme